VDDDSLHSLLAGGKLSGAQRERVLAGALRESQRRSWRVAGALALALPAAAAAVFFLRGGPNESDGVRSQGAFAAKGDATPLLGARCPDRTAGECRWGDRLIFEEEGTKQPGFFAAYADCPSRERIWYFPTATGAMPRVVPTAGPWISEQAARIGPEHGEGRCTLSLFLLPEPLSRARIAALPRTPEGAHSNVVIAMKP
jgi:hypothetical protein